MSAEDKEIGGKPPVSTRMSIGKISEFNVQNGAWSSDVDRLEMFFKVNDIKEDLRVPIMISVMGDEAYELLANLCSPKKPSELKFSEASECLRQHLQPSPSVIAERYQFRQRRQQQDESVAEYMAELKKLARHCQFGNNLSENLRDQFVCGLKGDVTRQRLFAEDEKLTFSSAAKIAMSLEAAERNAAAVEIRGAAGNVGEVHSMQAGSARAGRPRPQRGASGAGRGGGSAQRGATGDNAERSAAALENCNGCGATSHDYGSCRFRDFVCSRCGRRGHLRWVCRSGGATQPRQLRGGKGSRGFHYGEADCSEVNGTEPEEDMINLHQLCLKDFKPI